MPVRYNFSIMRTGQKYVGSLLVNEWNLLEEDLGLNFVEIMEGDVSELFESPLRWADMVRLMGEQGLRGPDVMIANLFSRSKFQILITTDGDFESCLSTPLIGSDKAILLLE